MTGLAVAAVLAAPSAPVPGGPPAPPPAAGVDRAQAQAFAHTVYNLAAQLEQKYVRQVPMKDLVAAAVRGLYEEAGVPVPDAVADAVARAGQATPLVDALVDARVRLGAHPKLAGAKSLFAAANGLRHATDPLCQLAPPRAGTAASADQEFGVGVELEGVVGARWAVYQVEHGTATGRVAPVPGWFGPVPRPDAVPSPAGLPWRVRRVVPGSPAQRAGVRPGDEVTHLNGAEVTPAAADRLFTELVNPPPFAFDPIRGGGPPPPQRTLTFRRGSEKPFTAALKADGYTPESAFGVFRSPDGGWDCMLDREYKIGYLRLGTIELELDKRVDGLLADLEKRGCRALVLDLRWCPGGYVDPAAGIAGLFLRDGALVAKMEYRNPTDAGASRELVAPPGGGRYPALPLVVLVGGETTGGGELIAAALRDNGRCEVLGQRTAGRASIQSVFGAFGGLQYRITTGTSYRPNGKNRQKTAASGPTDDWGIRPDDGLEVPVTADKSADLRRQADLHALRPAGSRDALPFDDPDADPVRLAALAYLRKKLGPPR